MQKKLIVILGPTASGKTTLAVKLADELNGEVLSADSRQVYRGMDIGTGKDLTEYCVNGKKIHYHLIDILYPSEEFNVFEYQKIFYEIYATLIKRNILPILVGGTGLYLEAVLTGYQLPYAGQNEKLREELSILSMDELRRILLDLKPHLHNKTDLEDRDRLIRKIEIEQARKISSQMDSHNPNINADIFGVFWERSELRKRIAIRLEQRLSAGMIDEVESLHQQGISWDRLESFGLEYRYIAWYLQGKMSSLDMKEKLQISIGQFAKRQMTWFRRMEKKGVVIEWIRGNDYALLMKRVLERLS